MSQAGRVWLVKGGCTAKKPDTGSSPPLSHLGMACLSSGLRMCNDNIFDCIHAAQHSVVRPGACCNGKGAQLSCVVQEPVDL